MLLKFFAIFLLKAVYFLYTILVGFALAGKQNIVVYVLYDSSVRQGAIVAARYTILRASRTLVEWLFYSTHIRVIGCRRYHHHITIIIIVIFYFVPVRVIRVSMRTLRSRSLIKGRARLRWLIPWWQSSSVRGLHSTILRIIADGCYICYAQSGRRYSAHAVPGV